MTSSTREAAKIRRDLRRKGWTERLLNNGHYRMTHPNGGSITMANSPGAGRWLQNVKADIRRVERAGERGMDY